MQPVSTRRRLRLARQPIDRGDDQERGPQRDQHRERIGRTRGGDEAPFGRQQPFQRKDQHGGRDDHDQREAIFFERGDLIGMLWIAREPPHRDGEDQRGGRKDESAEANRHVGLQPVDGDDAADKQSPGASASGQ